MFRKHLEQAIFFLKKSPKREDLKHSGIIFFVKLYLSGHFSDKVAVIKLLPALLNLDVSY